MGFPCPAIHNALETTNTRYYIISTLTEQANKKLWNLLP